MATSFRDSAYSTAAGAVFPHKRRLSAQMRVTTPYAPRRIPVPAALAVPIGEAVAPNRLEVCVCVCAWSPCVCVCVCVCKCVCVHVCVRA